MQDPTEHPGNGAQRVALANGISRLAREYTGRGPVKARAEVVGDMVMVLMHTSLTKAEQTLAAEGKAELVTDRRRADQHAMEGAMKEVVTEITGRPVLAFLSADHLDPDIALEFFVLEPANGAASERA
ncbi:MAG: hypothetical protein QOE06_2055 [Thermoleophilaceae bacterium]|jgi:uncharacterized protein YbcI|nr:hypothetical protein [Thermoleophilaceae bacterium]